MFDKQYRFRGSHADRVTKLTSQFESFRVQRYLNAMWMCCAMRR